MNKNEQNNLDAPWFIKLAAGTIVAGVLLVNLAIATGLLALAVFIVKLIWSW